MRIALISPYPPSLDSNSLFAELYSESICSIREDTHFTVLAGSHEGETRSLRRFGNRSTIDVRRVWSVNMTPATILRNIRRELATPHIDLIHIHFNWVTFGSFLSSQKVLSQLLADFRDRIPTVVTLHSTIVSPARKVLSDLSTRGLSFLPERDPTSLPFDVLTNRVVKNSTVVVMPSAAGIKHIRPVLDKDSTARLYHIPLGSLPPAIGYQWSSNRRESDSDGEYHVAYVGNIAPYKGVDDLVMSFPKVLREIRGSTLVISGSPTRDSFPNGSYVAHLGRLIKQLKIGSRVEAQHKYLPVEAMLARIDRSDVVVYPFKNDGIASMSASVYDALPSPKPIVITDSPRLEDFRGFCGVAVVKSDDPDALAHGIISALSTARSRLTYRAKELAPHSPESISFQYLALYDKAMTMLGSKHVS